GACRARIRGVRPRVVGRGARGDPGRGIAPVPTDPYRSVVPAVVVGRAGGARAHACRCARVVGQREGDLPRVPGVVGAGAAGAAVGGIWAAVGERRAGAGRDSGGRVRAAPADPDRLVVPAAVVRRTRRRRAHGGKRV